MNFSSSIYGRNNLISCVKTIEHGLHIQKINNVVYCEIGMNFYVLMCYMKK